MKQLIALTALVLGTFLATYAHAGANQSPPGGQVFENGKWIDYAKSQAFALDRAPEAAALAAKQAEAAARPGIAKAYIAVHGQKMWDRVGSWGDISRHLNDPRIKKILGAAAGVGVVLSATGISTNAEAASVRLETPNTEKSVMLDPSTPPRPGSASASFQSYSAQASGKTGR